jgi:hypothetical protein
MNKPRTVKAMREYLKDHFRYNTMNSWNHSTSYAREVKITHIIDDSSLCSKAFDFLDMDEAFWGVHRIIRDFESKHDYKWQIGFNGRSSGYLVLYQGGKEDSGYKTQCDTCDRYTYSEDECACAHNGCDGTLRKLESPVYRTFSRPGKSFDQDEDFESLDKSELQWRVDIVWDFDKTVDSCIAEFIDFVKTHSVEDKTIMVPKQIRVAVAS